MFNIFLHKPCVILCILLAIYHVIFPHPLSHTIIFRFHRVSKNLPHLCKVIDFRELTSYNRSPPLHLFLFLHWLPKCETHDPPSAYSRKAALPLAALQIISPSIPCPRSLRHLRDYMAGEQEHIYTKQESARNNWEQTVGEIDAVGDSDSKTHIVTSSNTSCFPLR